MKPAPEPDQPIPVLLMSQQLGPGGTERQLAATALGLDRKLFAPHAVCFINGARSEELERGGIPVLNLPVRSLKSAEAVSAAWRLAQYMRRHRIQVAHAFDYPLACFGLPIAKAVRVPVVLSSQRGERALVPPLYRKILRATDRIVKGIVVNCEAMRRHLEIDESLPASFLHVCHNGLEIRAFDYQPRVRKPQLEGACVVIGTICVLRPEKDICTLVDAFASVARARADVKLAIVGSGPSEGEIRARVAAHGLTERVVFEPATADVAGWLRSIDIFVLTSLTEALSNSLMEAMACGCAAIASRVGGNPELITEGETGLLAEAGNAEAFARAIETLVNDEQLRRRLAVNARAKIREQFSLAAAARRMGEIYLSLLANGG